MFGIVLYNLFNLEARAVKKMLISLQQFLLFFFNEPFLFFLDPEYNNDAKQSAFPQSHQFSKGIHSN